MHVGQGRQTKAGKQAVVGAVAVQQLMGDLHRGTLLSSVSSGWYTCAAATVTYCLYH